MKTREDCRDWHEAYAWRTALITLAMAAGLLMACGSGGDDDDDDGSAATDAGETDSATGDGGTPGDDSGGGADASPDLTEPLVELYDFAANAPWYPCSSAPYPDGITSVTAFESAYQYFGAENLRTVEAEVDFPEAGTYSQVGMILQLDCPDSGICDAWDRSGSIQMVLDPTAPAEEREYLELMRHITAYRVPMCVYIDVTPVASLLRGTQILTSFIDTWVGPGHSDGEGWNTTVRFVFYPGPSEGADEVINVWGFRNITVGEVDNPVDGQIEPVTVGVPESATRVYAHLTTTGHSFGNALNCAEFCQMRHDVIVNGQTFSVNPWRADCASNPVSPQYGTWEYGRNGWCPGAVSVGDLIDITEAILPGDDNTIDADILLSDGSVYNNTTPVDLRPYTYLSLKLYVYE